MLWNVSRNLWNFSKCCETCCEMACTILKSVIFNHFWGKNIIKYSLLNTFDQSKPDFHLRRVLKSLIIILSFSVILEKWIFEENWHFLTKNVEFGSDFSCVWLIKNLIIAIIHDSNGLLNLILRDWRFERSHPGFKNLFSQSIPLEKCTYSHWIPKSHY